MPQQEVPGDQYEISGNGAIHVPPPDQVVSQWQQWKRYGDFLGEQRSHEGVSESM